MTTSSIIGIVTTVLVGAAWFGLQILLYIKCGKDD